MAMVVKNNMSAVNTLNVLNANSAALAKDLQQVATGMKVNSAADDNSGYAISERMRVRIRALEQADQNTQNGANMLKVAEGGIQGIVDELREMKQLAINAANKTICIDGNPIALTRTEYELLKLLLEHHGQMFSRQQLLDSVWPQDVIVTERTVDVNVARLRKKLGRYAVCLVSRTGFGYGFEKKSEA
jgi:DNA-binding response OmpR family regulator